MSEQSLMKAVAWTKYGTPEVLKLKEFARPAPNKNEVLIRVHASSVTAGDARLRATKVPVGFWLLTRLAFGLTKPRKAICGMEFSGEVVLTGGEVALFKQGDLVYGTTGMRLGANAEYVCLPQDSAMVKKPDNITHAQAVAVIFGGLTAIHFLKESVFIRSGQKVLINGASGAVGTASIQLAKHYRAEVTGVCSASNVELIKSLGADHVIDYTKVDVNQYNETFDVIFDAVGNLSFAKIRHLLTNEGQLILINAGLPTILSSIFRKNVICGVAAESKEALNFLRTRVESGEMKAVIDKTYALEQIVEAHRYVDTGRKKGSVVIAVAQKGS